MKKNINVLQQLATVISYANMSWYNCYFILQSYSKHNIHEVEFSTRISSYRDNFNEPADVK